MESVILFFIFFLLVQLILLFPSLLLWTLAKRFWPNAITINPYLATFICCLLSISLGFALNLELESGIISAVVITGELTLILSLVICTIRLIWKYGIRRRTKPQ